MSSQNSTTQRDVTELDSALDSIRDPVYEDARFHRDLTWRKEWWRMSDQVVSLVLRRICAAWSCQPEDLLAPVEHRSWTDYAEVPLEGELLRVPGYRLNRPARQ